MLRIGLTGGIGCGKSTVCEVFREYGIPVIDSDIIARELVEPETPALQQIVNLFGEQVLQQDGSLNRAKMRELVFNNRQQREQLESLLHPLIHQEMLRQLAAIKTPYVIIAIPLLLEKGWQRQLDRVVVVDCSEEQQRDRAAQRDGSSMQTINQIIASQISRDNRLRAADDIIDNSRSLESLRSQIQRLHHHYLTLAANN